MKRALLLAVAVLAAIAFALPATSMAATFRGVVIAKDSARKSLVTASRNGVVRTVRARAAFKHVRVGRLVAVQAAALPDGTYAASKVRMLRKSRHAHFRATVVSGNAGRLVLSAGHSVFSLRVRGAKAPASEGSGDFKPGDDSTATRPSRAARSRASRKHVKKIGHSGELVLEGIYLGTDDEGTIELAVVHKGRVFVHVPEGMDVPEFQPGDEIALEVTVDDEGSFTLVKAENESSPGRRRGRRRGRPHQRPGRRVLRGRAAGRAQRRVRRRQGRGQGRAGALRRARRVRPDRLRDRPEASSCPASTRAATPCSSR